MKVNVTATATATKSVMARLLNRQLFYRTLAVLATGLGMVGVILPLLPTTPFLIVAVWAAGKSSPRLEFWLLEHPQFGPLLKGWRDRGAIPVFAKYLAGLMLTSSWVVLWLLNMKIEVLIFLAVFFSALMAYIISRPNA
ncbi:YbaN family protein [Kangiella aquimarina]|uniref:Inner membrane protein n=1 Tax=Kangiella aquimarina TaxID=261965 RepID=A0ABZ0X6F1_9GAMM|nr:YbaN family protein [Kangiella aquimarina]WQG86183.1 YbaN family protein [Kangiella aquimarina]